MDEGVDYAKILQGARQGDMESTIAFLQDELPWAWLDAYASMVPYKPNVYRIQVGTFEYLFDFVTDLVQLGAVSPLQEGDDRVVAGHGFSAPALGSRQDSILRGAPRSAGDPGWPLADRGYDRGHLMAHASGGGTFINIFPQLARVNRGRSLAGKEFRAMERYCRAQAGTYCFARPVYDGPTMLPVALEFGILKADATLWVRQFSNTVEPADLQVMNRAFAERLQPK